MAKRREPAVYDPTMYIQAGINPETGLPIKFGSTLSTIANSIENLVRIKDEQESINRYEWYNLPSEIDETILERVIYYRGQGALFYLERDRRFYFLPFTLSAVEGSGLDVYGRWTGISPIQFNGSTGKNEKEIVITSKTYIPVYDLLDAAKPEMLKNGAVILSDYSRQISQTIVSRSILQQPIIRAIAEAPAFARTNLLVNSGIRAWRVNDSDQESNVKVASRSIESAALCGNPFIPITAPIEFQDMTNGGSVLKSEEFLLYMQSLDNLRMSFLGIKNGGIFQKKAHMLQEEQDINESNVDLVLLDGLKERQKFCMLANAIWGLGIWCEIRKTKEEELKADEEDSTRESKETVLEEGGEPDVE